MPYEPPPTKASARAVLERHKGAIVVLMNLMLVRHLASVYHEFEGDVVEAIVLGEIAHYNLSPLIGRARNVHELSAAIGTGDAELAGLVPTNTYSIAQATGIPRETVRRKVAKLARRGWIVRERGGNLFVAADTHSAFTELHVERLRDLLATSRSIETLFVIERRESTRRRRQERGGTRASHARS